MASTAKTPIRYYGDAEHPRETVDPETGICTWKAGVMESRIEMDNLQHAQARAEAYHAGDRSREIDNISKGYLLAKYPLVKEYQRWEQVHFWEEIFDMAVEYEEFCESERACAESRTLNENESQAQAPENPTPNEMAPAPSSEPESKRSAAPDEEDLISFD